MLFLHILSPVLLLLNFVIEIFLVASRSFQNIRRQYRVWLSQDWAPASSLIPVFTK